MPPDVGLWFKPLVYLVVVFALAIQTNRVGNRAATLLPPDERRGAYGYDPDLVRTLNLNNSPWRMLEAFRLRREIYRMHKGEAAFDRIRGEQQRWLTATLLVVILGLPLLEAFQHDQ
jgi:hypothetical protein